ncbi:MAG: phosphatidylserine/phosphatidylglycerophosphate/cardiolipin synthase family protein [Acidimicrobiia bacterium]
MSDPTSLEHVTDPSTTGSTERFRGVVASAVGALFTEGNAVSVLRNGREIFPSMLEAIRGAERTIDLVTFVYWTGQIAVEFAEALSARARAGVRVRIILDAFGSAPMNPELTEMMINAGVVVERFRPMVRWKMWESDHRTHRKILVVDERVGFSGGVGIAEEWQGDARNPQEWRETHFRIEGPAVLGLRAAFLTDWRDCGHSLDVSDIETEIPPKSGDVEIAVIDGSAQIGLNDAERVLEALVVGAAQRILIQTPYLNPVPELSELLGEAAQRGVSIDIVIPGPHLDKRIADVVAEEHAAALLGLGIRVWRYQPTMMHVKAVLVDGVIGLVGSVNVNRRSVEKDEEVGMLILDRDVVANLETHFREDVARSVPASPSLVDRSFGRKIASTLLRPIRSEM